MHTIPHDKPAELDASHLNAEQRPPAVTCADDTGRHCPACQITGGLVGLSDLLDTLLAQRLQAYRDGYAAALDNAVVASLARAWPAPGHVSELERRRYGPGGRASWLLNREDYTPREVG